MKNIIEKYKNELAKLRAELKDMPMCDKELRLSGTVKAYEKFIKDLETLHDGAQAAATDILNK